MSQPDEHDLGLSHDLSRLLSRRRALALIGGVGAFGLAGCATDDGDSSAIQQPQPPTAPSPVDSATESKDGTIPEETAGPYPADGSNGRDVLNQSGIVRSDIRSSFGSASAVAEGVPLTINLTLVDVANDSTPLNDAAVYLWHCDRDGQYSMYSDAVANENYLRGIQVADDKGKVQFTSIYPACYSGRWPHIHFEIYPSLQDATQASSRLRTTQLALPASANHQVFATAGYEASVSNLQQVSLDTDLVFSDGYSLQLASVSGDAERGMTASLTVPV